mgnify:CR=1 FL=1|tara:strand:- start:4020 stop:4838 length:819 start_codon:yes stop_codon:yes gene_type:complete
MNDLSIIIVSYNTCSHLDACLYSLTENPPQCKYDITVVDNGSTDGSIEMVKSKWRNVRLIETGCNLGYAAANNYGIRETESEFILLLNSDTIVHPETVDLLIKQLKQQDDVGIVAPRIVDSDSEIELSHGSMINPWNSTWQRLKEYLLRRQFPFISKWITLSASKTQFADWVSGACLLVRRNDALQVGLLDERFFLYTEDVDFCSSIRALDKKILYFTGSTITHYRGQSSLGATTHQAYRQSLMSFYAKHYPSWLPLLRFYLRLINDLPRRH